MADLHLSKSEWKWIFLLEIFLVDLFRSQVDCSQFGYLRELHGSAWSRNWLTSKEK